MPESATTYPQRDETDECWVVTNGAAGNERQALALAGCLPWPVRAMTLHPRAPWSWLAPRKLPGGRLAWPASSRGLLVPPWPAMIIGCGRSAALCTRVVRQLAGDACRSVQILDPRVDPRHWDMVIAPQHDGLEGGNVLTPLGSLNPVDAAWLDDARQAWTHLGDLPSPRLGVLLGGPRHDVPLDAAHADQLIATILNRHRREGGSVLLLGSRRTPAPLFKRLRAAFADVPGLCRGSGEDGTNPYPGVLAWADRLIVTPDSVNMLSEACATGRPVHTLVQIPLGGKLARFHANLRKRHLLHDMDADPPPSQPALRETAGIAADLCRRLSLPATRTPD